MGLIKTYTTSNEGEVKAELKRFNSDLEEMVEAIEQGGQALRLALKKWGFLEMWEKILTSEQNNDFFDALEYFHGTIDTTDEKIALWVIATYTNYYWLAYFCQDDKRAFENAED